MRLILYFVDGKSVTVDIKDQITWLGFENNFFETNFTNLHDSNGMLSSFLELSHKYTYFKLNNKIYKCNSVIRLEEQ